MSGCILQRLLGTAQDTDEDFKWRPPTGDGVLGKKEEYQADDNEAFRVDDEVPLGLCSTPSCCRSARDSSILVPLDVPCGAEAVLSPI